jgi:phosphoserine phosphatase RsbU/P
MLATTTPPDLEPILAVTGKLAAPFDLTTMLSEVVAAAKQVLKVERGTVWLYDREADELVLRFSEDVMAMRIPAGKGLVGSCARTRSLINVRDCYADPRFDPSTDRRTGFRTRCMLTLPLVDHDDELVGVLQVLNKADGVFEASDERLAMVLAAQCAVALQRVRMTEAIIAGEKMRQELQMARIVQMSSLPASMPWIAGYDLYGTFEPADLTGGDTFDLAAIDQGLLVVLGDATGHGIAPALSVTQMHAMLRMAFRMGASLESAFMQVNNQLADILPADRFITAFIGLLDSDTHRLRFHSGGQAPILHYRAAADTFETHNPTSFPLAAMPLSALEPAVEVDLGPGDILALVSDGIFEYVGANGEQFGEERVRELLRDGRDRPMADLTATLLAAVRAFAAGAPQEDDMTVVLVKREAAAVRDFPRRMDAIEEIVAFTAGAFEALGLDPLLRTPIDLALEELFTNVVKYDKGGGGPVRIALARKAGGVEATLTVSDVDRFDPTSAREVDIGAPIDKREPGGLGLHLIRQFADSLDYQYDEARRRARVVFAKKGA